MTAISRHVCGMEDLYEKGYKYNYFWVLQRCACSFPVMLEVSMGI